MTMMASALAWVHAANAARNRNTPNEASRLRKLRLTSRGMRRRVTCTPPRVSRQGWCGWTMSL